MAEANKEVTEKTAEQQLRGQLTQRIKDKSFELLGYEITQVELRLIPHLTYVMVNGQVFNPEQFSAGEAEALIRWRALGLLISIGPFMRMTAGFWDICSELLWLGYVDLKS